MKVIDGFYIEGTVGNSKQGSVVVIPCTECFSTAGITTTAEMTVMKKYNRQDRAKRREVSAENTLMQGKLVKRTG